jgi:endoglucanase
LLGDTSAASINAMKAWRINIVRIPLNEHCWLGINGVNAAYAGQNYINAIKGYVNIIRSAGLAVILELHWALSGSSAIALGTKLFSSNSAKLS